MSNRVVCREASHAGSWYTASGRAPGRPARQPAAAAWPRARPAEVGGPAPRGGGRDEGADGRRPRDRVGRERPGGRPRRLPHPGGIPPGSPGRPPSRSPRSWARGRVAALAACALPRDQARGKNVLPVLPDPSLLVAFSSSREAGGRALPPPGGQFARRPSPASPTRGRGRDARSCARGCSPPAVREAPATRAVLSVFQCAQPILLTRLRRGSLLPLPLAVWKEAAFPSPLRCSAVWRGVQGSTFSRCQTRGKVSACEIC